MTKAEAKMIAKEITTNEGYILQIEKRIEEKETTLKDYEETFNEKMAAGKTVKSLVLTASKIAHTLNDIEELKNQIAGYQARIDSLQAEIDAASVEEVAIEEEIENLLDEVDNGEFAVEVVVVDLSNEAGVKTAESQICAILPSNSLSDGDYALVKMAHKMITEIVADDELFAKLAAEGKIPADYYQMTAYTSEHFLTITLNDMPELMEVKDLMMFAKVREGDDYTTSWGKGLIRGFSFNRNAVVKAVIYALNLAGIKADGKTDYAMVEEVSTENDAPDVEIENAAVNVGTKFEVGKIYFTKNYADCYGSTMLFKVVNRDEKKIAIEYFETPPRRCVGGHTPEHYTISTAKGVECVYISEGYTLYVKDLHSGKYAGVNATDDKYETLEIINGVIQKSAAKVESENANNNENEVQFKRNNFVANVFDHVGKFKIKLARAGNNTYIDENDEYTCKMTDKNISDGDLYYIEFDGKFKILLMIGLHDIQLAEYDNEADTKKAIIAMAGAVKRGENFFTFPVFKSAIDWAGVRQDLNLFQRVQKMNLLKKFQVEAKKFIKLGEFDIAEEIFTVIKTILKKTPAELAA